MTDYGSFVVERDGDREDVSGPAVILVHRLLKNTVIESGGPPAYAFLTVACLDRLPPAFALPEHTESYEPFGEVNGGIHDLLPVLEAMRAAQHEYIGPAEADFEITYEVPYAPAVLCQYFVDPDKRVRWQPNQKALDTQPNELGRLGTGAASHCAHGLGPDALREYLDWSPYAVLHLPIHAPAPDPVVRRRRGDHGVRPDQCPHDDGPLPVPRRRSRPAGAQARARSFAVLYRAIAKRAEQRCREIIREDGFVEWSEADERAG